MDTEQIAFWDSSSFAVVTDKSKPAIKLTINELKNRGKGVHVIDLSSNPDPEAFNDVSEIPDGVETAVIGVTKTEPADIMKSLEERGIKRFWIHWRTDTQKTKEMCNDSEIQCVIGKCPMMYLGSGLSIHGLHRSIAKLVGKY
ncbi:MAG: CoA-binding protein [Methanosarcinaceae archaeon]|nr:CoA-binding protein [Methanosarcinaceae archaeon]